MRMTHSDDVITTATDKRTIKISPILLYALFVAFPSNIVTANIFGYTVSIECSVKHDSDKLTKRRVLLYQLRCLLVNAEEQTRLYHSISL